MRQFQSVSKPVVTKAAVGTEADVAKVLQTQSNAGQVSSEYGVSARRLIVRGKGEVDKPMRSGVSIIKPNLAMPESVIGTDDRIRVLDPETMPWRMICSLEISGRTGRGIGTGWFAGPKTIITAGHCVYHPNFGGWADEIKIYPGRYGSNFPFPQNSDFQQPIVSSKFDSVEGWVKDLNADYDLAVIHLTEPAGNETGWFSIAVKDDATLDDLLVNISGYPADLDFGRYQYFAASKIAEVKLNRFFYTADTYGGQSGAPVWYQDEADRPVVIGIHSYGVGNFTLNSATRINTDTFQVIKGWIDADNQI